MATIHYLFGKPAKQPLVNLTGHMPAITSRKSCEKIGARWENTRTASMEKIRQLVRSDIDYAIANGGLPKGEYRIIINETATLRSLRISVHDLRIAHVFSENVIALCIDTIFQNAESFLSDEAKEIMEALRSVVNNYNRRILSVEGRLTCSHFESEVILNSAFVLKAICNETAPRPSTMKR